MQQYLSLVADVYKHGNRRLDRTGTGTISRFGPQIEFDLAKGFPLLSAKFTPIRLIIEELIWFLSGDTNNNTLVEKNIHIWDEWAITDRQEVPLAQRTLQLNTKLLEDKGLSMPAVQAVTDEDLDATIKAFGYSLDDFPRFKVGPKDGDLGPVYGAMWREWPGVAYLDREAGCMMQPSIDQIQELIDGLKKKPFSRRHIVSGWNPALLPDESKSHAENVSNGKQALPPCHTLFQFYVSEKRISEIADEVGEKLWHKMLDDIHAPSLLEEDALARAFAYFKAAGVKMLKLDCQLYQR